MMQPCRRPQEQGPRPYAIRKCEASAPMKSPSDAALRTAAEVVTQLPVPARLGMLRFERLNEASWALLYLDPNCERHFGLPASELCALVGPIVSTSANPAGLPAARTRLKVEQYFRGQIDHVLGGNLGGRKNPSLIRDLATGKVMRPA